MLLFCECCKQFLLDDHLNIQPIGRPDKTFSVKLDAADARRFNEGNMTLVVLVDTVGLLVKGGSIVA